MLLLLFLVSASILTWPLVTQLSVGIPLGTERVATVPLFNLWTLEWNRVALGSDGYWDAPIFHPHENTFALSEPQPVTGAVAGVLTGWLGSPVVAYNLTLLLALILNAFLGTVFLRRVGLSWAPAVAGGLFLLVLPFTHQEWGVLQLVPLAGLLTLLLALHHFTRGPEWRRGLVLGGAAAFAYGICGQTTVFLVLAVLPAVFWLWRPFLRQRRFWLALAAALGLFSLLCAPILLAQGRLAAQEDFARSPESVARQSAQIDHYFQAPWPELLPLPGVETAESPSRRAFWPGTLKVLLAILGLWGGWRRPALRSVTVAALLLLATAWILSLGPHFAIGGVSLPVLLRALPGVSQIRSFFRFALVVQLTLATLAAGGLAVLWHWAGKRSGRWRRAHLCAVALLGVLAIGEMWPVQGPIQPLPSADLELPWLRWVESVTEEDDVFAFVPFPEGRGVGDYLGTAQWMYWQTRHWRPMVNGYSGFFPEGFRELKARMTEFPSPTSLRALKASGVNYCVVHRAFVDPRVMATAALPDVHLELVFEDPEHALDIYRLR